MFKNKLSFLAPAALALLVFGPAANAAIVTTDILAAITDGQTAGVVVSLGFGVALWILKGTKLVRPR